MYVFNRDRIFFFWNLKQNGLFFCYCVDMSKGEKIYGKDRHGVECVITPTKRILSSGCIPRCCDGEWMSSNYRGPFLKHCKTTIEPSEYYYSSSGCQCNDVKIYCSILCCYPYRCDYCDRRCCKTCYIGDENNGCVFCASSSSEDDYK